MEDINKEEMEVTEEETEATSPETQEESEDNPEGTQDTNDEENIDYKKELEEKTKGSSTTELDKAKKALFFNAERLKELGGKPEEILGIKPQKQPKPEETDISEVVNKSLERKFAEKEAQSLSKSADEFNLIMWYVDNRQLSVEEAHLLANKGKIARSFEELKRSNPTFGQVNTSSTKADTVTVPQRSEAEVKILAERGLRFNPKTKTYQGKFYEEYYDREAKAWKSRKMAH